MSLTALMQGKKNQGASVELPKCLPGTHLTDCGMLIA